ncbi:hypothetical protein GCM10022409_29210 [Hymenobacter glaciei]|uniref:Sulfatase-modifying factor enzyme-like domain-containing protein n=1 Tax=Hymenobacter glaciei TaxID=877209 RepID=A0ABP7UE06_9BACT
MVGLSGCYTPRPPSGAFPGLYSATTGLLNLTREYGASRDIFDDDKAIRYSTPARFPACGADTSFVVKLDWAAFKSVPGVLPIGMPAAIVLARDGRGIDESEVANIEWKRYRQQLEANGFDLLYTNPTAEALPVADYFTNPYYDYFPVVGISYEQANAFCLWRGHVIANALNRDKLGSPDSMAAAHVVVECRLPTEAEWEQAALAKRGLPYGSKCPEIPFEINPEAAAYFKKRSGSVASEQQIRADIRAYNRTRPARFPINCDQSGPYFLHLASPAYVYDGPTNDYRLYNLLGNAAEMIQERGIAKGGSYRDPLAACTVTSRSTYSGPSPTVGFRCITKATQPNRK